MATETKAFKCDYCGKLHYRKGNTERHEDVCSKNPVNHHACTSCIYFRTKTIESEYEVRCGVTRKHAANVQYCEKKQIYLKSIIYEKRAKNIRKCDSDIEFEWNLDIEFETTPKECAVRCLIGKYD